MEKTKECKGIGGWLILPTIGLVIASALYIFVCLILLFELNGSVNVFAVFLFSGLFAYLSIKTLILEFKHKKEFPIWAVSLMWAEVIIVFSGEIILGIEVLIFEYFPSIVGIVIWTLYFKKSKRVKNTFIK